MNIPPKIWMLGAAALGVVVLGALGYIDGETLREWLPVIYTDATGAE